MRLLCIAATHKTAAVDLRERLTFDQAGRDKALAELAGRWPDAEAVILSTCNRSDVYVARPAHGRPREQELRDWLAEFHGLNEDDLAGAVVTLADDEAARHLFTVAAGLDSMVPGEAQIVGQIKEAYAAAGEAGTAGAVLNTLFQSALRSAKQVRSQTAIGEGKVSVASVAVDCVLGHVESLAGKTVLNVGAGKMNELMLRRLAELSPAGILIANRSPARAAALAKTCDGQAVPFADIAARLAEADIVVTSTAAHSPILTRSDVAPAMAGRADRPLLIVDIAVPRDVAADVGELPGVTLRNIDDLNTIVRRTMDLRCEQRDAAERLIAEHVDELTGRLDVRHVVPVIKSLYRRMEQVAAEELAAAGRKLATHADAEEDLRIIRRTTHRIIRRMLHPAARNLRRRAGSDQAKHLADVLRELFELDEDQSD